MVTSEDCIKKYGLPDKHKNLMVWEVPVELQQGVIPKRIYCNRDMVLPLRRAFRDLIDLGIIAELKTWDGCFNIRKKRGGSTFSLHSWGIAVDVNASTNKFGEPPTLSKTFIKCFKDAGFDWGGEWRKPDGMHFQIKMI
jgi:hypothetical protein